MAESIISYQLDLIVRLIDTTTGSPVSEQQILFRESGQVLALLRRDAGLYVLLNHGRRNMTLQIEADGYEPVTIAVEYERMNPKFPELEIPLIPQLRSYGFEDYYTLTGKKPGITSVVAVRLENPVATVAGYVERKQLLKLFTAKRMEENNYALLHKDRQVFEEITVVRRPDKLSLKLLKRLTGGWRPEEPLNRIVRGSVDEDGTYLLRVRDLGGSNEYLVRYEINEEMTYEQIDFGMLGKEDA